MNEEKICVIAGMPRAATTFLYHTLQNHPNIFIPSRKEMDFFSVNYYRGIKWYSQFFHDMLEDQLGFDISPMYFLEPKAAERIKNFNPDVKVILMIREPVGWIFSLHQHMQKKSYKTLEFEKFLHSFSYKKDGKILNCSFGSNSVKNYLDHYRNVFGDNLLLCDYRVMNQGCVNLLNSIEKFISVSQFFTENNFENVIINASSDKSSKIMNILMQQKFFADMVTNFFPKKLILSIRYKMQSSNKISKEAKDRNPIKDKYINIVKDLYVPDIDYINRLFDKSSFVLGTGNSFEQS